MTEQMSGISSRGDLIGADLFWRIVHRDYENGKLKYVGKNTEFDALESSATWTIWKYFYEGDMLVSVEGPKTGAWLSRGSLSWSGSFERYFPYGVEPEDAATNNSLDEILIELREINEKLSVGLDEL